MIGVLTTVWEWLILAALSFWIGSLVVEGIVYADKEQSSALLDRAARRTRPLQWLCVTVLLVGEIITLILRAAQFSLSLSRNTFDPSVFGQLLFQSTYGFLWIARIILIFGLQWLVWWAATRQRQASPTFRLITATWLILAGLILLTYILTGTDTPSTTQLSISAVVLNWFSLTAQCIWFAGLAYLSYVFLPLLSLTEPNRRADALIALLRRFSPLMLAAIGVLFVSELSLTTINLGNVQQFAAGAYGRVLLVKWVLIVAMIACSVYSFFVLRSKLIGELAFLSPMNAEVPARRVRHHWTVLNRTIVSFRQLSGVQTWLGTAVLLCAALMTLFAPPNVLPNTNNGQYVPPASIPTGTPADTLSTQTKQVGNLSVVLIVTPAEANVSDTVTVRLTDTRGGKPVTNARIVISANMEAMPMPTTPTTMTGGAPAYKATFVPYTFSMSGIWDIRLSIQLPGEAPLVVVFSVLFLYGS